MKRLQTNLFDPANVDADAALGLGGLSDASPHFSIDDAASVRIAAPIVDIDAGPENDLAEADVASSMASDSVSVAFAGLAHPAAEPGETADIDVVGGSGDFFSGQWQREIGGVRLTGVSPDADDGPTQGNSCAAIPASSPPPTPLVSSSTEPNILANVANPPPAPKGVSSSTSGSDSNSAPDHNQGIGASPDLKFVGPEGPVPVVDNVGTIGSSHSGPAVDSPAVSASSGTNISQVTTNANGSTSETVTFAGSGIVFNDTFDATVTQAYKNCILSAEQTIASEWSNSVTINEEFSAQAEGQNGELASNAFYVYGISYAALKSALTTLASHELNDSYLQQAVAHLPSTDLSGGAGFELALPYARMLGLTSSSENPDDIVTLNTSYNWSYGQDVINTIEHEMSEGGMGRIGGLGDQNSFWSVMDLFRYNSSGAPDYSDGRDGRATYFSFNGGATLSSLSFNNEFNSHGQQVNSGDTADFVQQDVFGTGDPGETNTLSQTDIQIMEALGWDPPPQGPVVTVSNVTLNAGQASVAASLLFTASDPSGGPITEYGFTDTGPGFFVLNGATEPNNQEIDVTAAQLSQLSYQSALGTIDTLQVRAEDATGWGSWASFTVTAPPLVIESFGVTSLTEVGNLFFLYNSSGSGPTLKDVTGLNYVSGAEGAWAPIGAEQTASGYEVAWRKAGVDDYTVWNVDNNGNFVSDTIGGVSGSSYALESLEPSFHQDLNNDGVIGPPVTVIESFGVTSLTEVGNLFFLYNSSGSGPTLKDVTGLNYVSGAEGAWAPIGAEQTASGYEVAWKKAGVDDYTVWNVDSNGNFVSDTIGGVSGSSYALESLEPSFHQDLNNDGVIGPPVTVIESFGVTSLTEVGNLFFLYNSSGSGPTLKDVTGLNYVSGAEGAWAPIGAEQTASGYEVAWKKAGVDDYTVWNVDSNGNFVSDTIGGVSGSSYALESLEPSFHQDLNNDGVIGPPVTVIESFGVTSLTEVGNLFFLYNSSGSGPTLKDVTGLNYVSGAEGAWAPIGAEQTASGYEVAWKKAGVDDYTVWNVDSNGNFVSDTIGGVSGSSYALESLEPSFHQDLNNDGVIGVPGTNTIATQEVANGATLELAGANSGSASGHGSAEMLDLGHLSDFGGSNGNLYGADQIDLRDFLLEPGTAGLQNGGANGGTSIGSDVRHYPQTSDVTTANVQSTGTDTTVTQGPSVTVDGSGRDCFVFKEGFGVDIVTNVTGSDTIEPDGPSSIVSTNELLAFLSEEQTGHAQWLFESTKGGHEVATNVGNNNSIMLPNVQTADLHVSNFIIH